MKLCGWRGSWLQTTKMKTKEEIALIVKAAFLFDCVFLMCPFFFLTSFVSGLITCIHHINKDRCNA